MDILTKIDGVGHIAIMVIIVGHSVESKLGLRYDLSTP